MNTKKPATDNDLTEPNPSTGNNINALKADSETTVPYEHQETCN